MTKQRRPEFGTCVGGQDTLQNDGSIRHLLKAVIPDIAPDVDGMPTILLENMLRLVLTCRLRNVQSDCKLFANYREKLMEPVDESSTELPCMIPQRYDETQAEQPNAED